MRYEKPELIVVDAALSLVLGLPLGLDDNGVEAEYTMTGSLGLDE